MAGEPPWPVRLTAAAEADFRSQTGQLSGHVRIGSGPIPAASLARTLVPEAKRRLPGIRVIPVIPLRPRERQQPGPRLCQHPGDLGDAGGEGVGAVSLTCSA